MCTSRKAFLLSNIICGYSTDIDSNFFFSFSLFFIFVSTSPYSAARAVYVQYMHIVHVFDKLKYCHVLSVKQVKRFARSKTELCNLKDSGKPNPKKNPAKNLEK